jgi:hypothetical protein
MTVMSKILSLTLEQLCRTSAFLAGLLDRHERYLIRPKQVYVLGGEEAGQWVEILDPNTLWTMLYKPVQVIESQFERFCWHGLDPKGQALRWRSPNHDDTLLATPVVTSRDRACLEGFLLEASSTPGRTNAFIERLAPIVDPLELIWHELALPTPEGVHEAIRAREQQLTAALQAQRIRQS